MPVLVVFVTPISAAIPKDSITTLVAIPGPEFVTLMVNVTVCRDRRESSH